MAEVAAELAAEAQAAHSHVKFQRQRKVKRSRPKKAKAESAGEVLAAGDNGDTDEEDVHDSSCQYCNKGGDLLMCDTCTYVFHIGKGEKEKRKRRKKEGEL